MRSPRWFRTNAALLLPALASACIPVGPPAPAVDPQGAPIGSGEIRAAMHTSRQTGYAIGLSLLGGAVGTLVFGKIGYEIGYAQDIKQGCEDCGLSGALTGAALGMVTGMVVGGNIGLHAGARADRADAIARIIRERARGPAAEGQRARNSSLLTVPQWTPSVAPAPMARANWAMAPR